MKYFKSIAILLLFVGCNTTAKKEKPPQEVVAQYQELNGEPVYLNSYKGKKILLNYWATWCAPCKAEMPALLRAQEILVKENYVFLLASDEEVSKIKNFKAQTNYSFHFIKFNGNLSQQNIYALPTTFIYNEAGVKVDEIVGAVTWDSKEMITKLKNIQ